jgi:hypothetical protein
MRIKIVKCEARNAVNIENIDKFRNKAVGDYKLMDAGHDLFRGSLEIWLSRLTRRERVRGCHKLGDEKGIYK